MDSMMAELSTQAEACGGIDDGEASAAIEDKGWGSPG